MGALKDLAIKATRKAMQNSPTIFATIAVGCVLGSVYGAIKATLKSREALDERDDQLEELKMRFEKDPSIDKAAQKEMIKQVNLNCAKKVAPNYIFTFITAVGGIVSIVKCEKGHGKKEAVMAGLLNFARGKTEEIIKKSEEVVGKKKTESLKDEVSIDKIKKIASSNPVIQETGHGSEIFIHEPTGQVFRCSKSWVERCINEVDHRLSSGEDDFVEMDDLLDSWGTLRCGLGKIVGFPAEKFTGHINYNGYKNLFDQTRFVNWENPDTGEIWKMIKHPYELYADGRYVSIPAY